MNKLGNKQYISIAILFLAVLIAFITIKPNFEKKIKNLIIAQASQVSSVASLNIEDVKIKLLPPHVRLERIEAELSGIDEIKSVTVKKLAVYPILVNLLSAQLKIKHILIDGAEFEVLESKKKSNQPLPEVVYDDLRALPFVSISLTNTKIKYAEFSVLAQNISLKKKWSSIEAYLKNIIAKDSTEVLPTTRLQSMRMNIYTDKITLGNFTLSAQNSYLQMGANLSESFSTKLLESPELLLNSDLNVSTKIDLADFDNLAQRFVKNHEQKVLSGSLQMSLYNKLETDNSPKLSFNASWSDFQFDSVHVQKAEVHGTLKKNKMNIYKLLIEDKNLNALAQDIQMNVDFKNKAASIDGSIQVTGAEIGQFLEQNLTLGKIPLYAPLKGKAKCKGPIFPEPNMDCQIEGQLGNLKVWSNSERTDKNIIADLTSHKFTASGNLNLQRIAYESSHQFAESVAQTHGQVDYKKGFDIQYSSDFLSFGDINNLANIPLAGVGKIQGATRGGSRWGVFNIDAEFTDFNFFEYNLGSTKSAVSYEKGQLYFKNSQSKINSSIIYADVHLDLLTNLINIKSHTNKVFVQDIFTAIKNIAEVPVYISGEGEMDLDLHGPLELGAMTYALKAKFNNGILHKDRYRNLDININAEQGQVDVKSSLFYLSDQFNIEGKVNPEGVVDIMAFADSVNLANINFFKDLGINLEGIASIKIDLKEHILLPAVSGHATTKTMNTATNMGSSDFDFIVHKDFSEFEGSFFDGRAKGRFMIPHNENATLGAIAEYSNFNPMALLTMFNSKITETEAQINITGSSNLISHGNVKNNLAGTIKFDQIIVGKESSYSLQSASPAELQIHHSKIDGTINLKDAFDNLFSIEFNSRDIHRAYGKLNLSFLKAFIPDLSDSRGMLELRSTFRIFPEFEMNGSGRIQNLFAKIENLKHPFQNISSDLTLQNTKILFQGTQGEFAGGTIDGAGFIDLRHGLKVNFVGKADRINLDIPEDVKTTSSGNFNLSGDDFPYTLGGNFKVHDGFVEMEFAGGDGGKYHIPISQHIPETDRTKTPLLFDLKIQTQQPLKVKNSMVDGTAHANLRIEGSPTWPIFTGTIDVTPNTQLIFQDKRFRLNSGQISFQQAAPEMAQLNISAETRITDNNEILGKDYDIQVIIQGTAKSPTLFFSSQPSLAENQILSLIALGVKDSYRPGQEVSADSQQSQTGYQLGGIFLQNEFARDLQDRLGVQVNFTSSFEDQDVSPKVMIQKKFNPKLSVTGSRTLGTNKRTSTQIEYKFTKNFSIIGGVEKHEVEDATLLRTRQFLEENVMGVDVQYSFEFE